MKLLPANKDIEAEYWQCKCRQILLKDRDRVFLEKTDEIKKHLNLKEFKYDKPIINNIQYAARFVIESAEWEEDDRLTSRRKTYSLDEHNHILEFLKSELEEGLQIQLYSIEDYFIE